MKKICVIGLGYIGLPTSILLAESGFEVVGFDNNLSKVNSINNQDPVIQEPEIYPRLKNALQEKSFIASAKIVPADFFIIAVPTPITEQKLADMSYVWSAGRAICSVIKPGDTIILESTSSVGSTQKLSELIFENTGFIAGKDFFIGYCPERVLPGNIFYELVYNDRVVGGLDAGSTKKIAEFYATFVCGEIIETDSKTAEMVKLVENSSRDVEIAFAHQVASMAYEAGINPYELIKIANKHPRVNILNPRCGVGGHCIAVDPWFLIESFPENSQLLKAAREVNDNKPKEVVDFILQKVSALAHDLNRPIKLSILGLTYKPNVDDLRESPALKVAQELSKFDNIELFLCEPNIVPKQISVGLDAKFLDLYQAIDIADVVLVLVAHENSRILFLIKTS